MIFKVCHICTMMSKEVLFVALLGVFLLISVTETSARTPAKKPKCKRNEVYNACSNGGCDPRNCTQLGYPVPCIKIDPKYCKGSCVCIDGYLRNSKGLCVPKRQCPSCGGDRNAIASECGQDCRNTCANYNKTDVRCSEFCYYNSCECKKGFLFDDNVKKCVRRHQCAPVCKTHEVFSECTNGGCQPKNCSELGYPVRCAKIDPASCIKGCICEEGYIRDNSGTCIPKTDCPSCGGDSNAVSSACGNNCQNTCANFNKTDVVCPLLCLLNSCECRPGYVYDDKSSKCILPEQCTQVCNNEREVYSECANAGCDAKTCAETGFKVPCVQIGSPDCVKGCRCVDDYIKADNGTCIPRSECPSCGGDPNAGRGCGINCGRHCSNYMEENVICPLRPCYINDCDCKPNFVFDDNIKRCVLPEDCTPTCEENEVYSSCVNGLCRPQSCCDIENTKKMSCRKPKKCRGGCVCIDGYLRDEEGVCVPQDQCYQY